MSTGHDAYATLPLDGIHAIEASAGTGKTFTLATLVLRLVVEGGLRIGQVLAVTFTEAATQELRSRLRQRLLLAARLVDAAPGDQAAPEAVITHALIAAHLARGSETPAALRLRLREAADGMDLAAVFTIHGFCARVLREHALESGQGFDAPELLANDAALRATIAADLWRAHGRDPDGADDLLALWKGGPEALAADLPLLVRERVLRPEPGSLGNDPAPALQEATDALVLAIEQQLEDARALVADAFDRKILHGSRLKRPSFDKAFDELLKGIESRYWPRGEKLHVDKLLPERLLAFCYDDKQSLVPASVLFDAFKSWCDADEAMQDYNGRRRVQRLHAIRDDARRRLATRKRQLRVLTYDDLIDRVADAIDGPGGGALAARLRAQYAVALVDEFQDTDPRQWRIFDRVFGSGAPSPGLFVIGDPKQAIYGFRGGDVETYLAARRTAREAPPLSANFRSRPVLLRAVDALYAQAGENAFLDPRIRFHPVTPGDTRDDGDFLRGGNVAPALVLWQAPPSGMEDAKGRPKPHPAGVSRELATAACTAAIHAVLSDAHAGKTTLARKDGRRTPVQPGDIAVLVRTHAEATRMRHALAEAGIPAVATGRQSLFATPEAADLHALLLALLHGADDGRLRRALATLLVGADADVIATLDDDGDALRHWQLHALEWRERLDRGGPLALVNALCAERAPQLLALFDGERRLTNYLQLGEQLQEAQAGVLGLHGLVDWLGRAMAGADAGDDTQLLRLESDARRVQIVTLHKSKGLEYPLVFLPFAGIGRNAPSPGARVVVHADAPEHTDAGNAPTGERVLHWRLQEATSGWALAKQRWIDAQQAEDARLLYVGLTRAEHALWLATGPLYAYDRSPLAGMVGDVDALRAALGDALVVDTTLPPRPASLPWLPGEAVAEPPRARIAAPVPAADWWVYSFSQLSKAEAGGDARSAATEADPGGRDEASDAAVTGEGEAIDRRFGGTGFGVVLHAALEHADFACWSGWMPGDGAPAGQDAIIARALREGGYAEADVPDGRSLLASLIGHTLTTRLPEGARLSDVPASDRRAEIEFQFALQPTRVDALLRLLHAHGVVTHRRGFGLRRRLEGLMTGLIDLTYHVDGRWYVLDYKSNRLPRYDAPALASAMAHGEYDLQALVYTLALHRWLRFRLGDAYAYERDFGGIRYLFCRGLDATHADARSAPGLVAHRYAPELVHALDALFAGNGDAEAAA